MFDTNTIQSGLQGFVAGFVLGGVYFGGLWLTIRRLHDASHPATIYFGSLVIRLVVLLAALIAILKLGGAPELAAALVGLIIARTALTRFQSSYRKCRIATEPTTARRCPDG